MMRGFARLTPVLALAALVAGLWLLLGLATAVRPAGALATGPALQQFPPAEKPGVYSLSQHRQYHYAAPYAAAAVRYAARATHREYGTAAVPMVVADCSTASGGTPAGRHPRGSHDGGINFDLTYYMKALHPTQGYVVCPENSNAHCTGPATLMDAERQAFFFATLARLNLEARGGLVRTAAVDHWVEQALNPVFDQLQAAGKFSPEVIRHAKTLVYSEPFDRGTGWFRFHHNHVHVRFQRVANSSAVAARIDAAAARLAKGAAGGD